MRHIHPGLVPLQAVLNHPSLFGSRIEEVEVERRGPRIFYEVEAFFPDRGEWEFVFDAQTGQLMQTEPDDAESACRQSNKIISDGQRRAFRIQQNCQFR